MIPIFLVLYSGPNFIQFLCEGTWKYRKGWKSTGKQVLFGHRWTFAMIQMDLLESWKPQSIRTFRRNACKAWKLYFLLLMFTIHCCSLPCVVIGFRECSSSSTMIAIHLCIITLYITILNMYSVYHETKHWNTYYCVVKYIALQDHSYVRIRYRLILGCITSIQALDGLFALWTTSGNISQVQAASREIRQKTNRISTENVAWTCWEPTVFSHFQALSNKPPLHCRSGSEVAGSAFLQRNLCMAPGQYKSWNLCLAGCCRCLPCFF